MSERTREWVVLPLLAGIWVLVHPYYGITHDGLLYAAQALNALQQDVFAQDVFFKYGSQDDFTIFSPLYAFGINILGLEQAAILFAIIFKLFWFAALVWMARGLLPGVWMPIGVALVISLSPFYDNDDIFSYGESFVTARLPAEAFGMLAIGALARGKATLAMVAALPALMLHPLIGLPVLMITSLSWVRETRRQLNLVGVSLVIAVLIMMLSSEDAGHALFAVFSQDWFDIIDGRTPEVFLHNWTIHGWARVTWVAVLWWAAFKYGDSLEKHLGKTLLLVICGSFVVAGLGGSLFHHVFLTQIQLWRVLWVGQLLGFLVLVRMLPKLRAGGLHAKLQVGALVLALFMGDEQAIILLLGASPVVFLLQNYYPEWKPARLHVVLLLLLVALVLYFRLEELANVKLLLEYAPGKTAWPIFTKEGWLLLAYLMLLVFFWGMQSERVKLGIFSVGVAVFCLSLAFWFHSHKVFSLATDENLSRIKTVQKMIPSSSVVFWESGWPQTWLLLQRPHYASHRQNAGALMNKASALETSRRMKRLLDRGFSEGEPKKRETFLKSRKEHTAEDVLYLCADPSLDFVIMSKPLPLAEEMRFILRIGVGLPEKRRFSEYYLYQCDRLHNMGKAV